MKNAAENLDSLTYQMSDDELNNLANTLFVSKTNGIDFNNLSYDEMVELTEFIDTIPFTKKLINSLSKLNIYSKEELEEENRKLYATQGWKQYI